MGNFTHISLDPSDAEVAQMTDLDKRMNDVTNDLTARLSKVASDMVDEVKSSGVPPVVATQVVNASLMHLLTASLNAQDYVLGNNNPKENVQHHALMFGNMYLASYEIGREKVGARG